MTRIARIATFVFIRFKKFFIRSFYFFSSKSCHLSLLFSLLLAISIPAKAACSDNAPAADTSVTCTGSDNTGIIASGDNVNVTVEESADVSTFTADAVISLQNSSSITNRGTIAGSNILTNNQMIGISAGGNSTVINLGTITVGNIGTPGQIAAGIGIFGNDSIISNSGSITSNSTSSDAIGILGLGINTVINNTGTINILPSGEASAAIALLGIGNSIIHNSGQLLVNTGTGFGNFGVYVLDSQGGGDLLVVNTGEITSSLGTGVFVSNPTGNNTIENYGTITGGDGTAINITGLTNKVIIGSQTVFNGNVVPQAGGANTLVLGGNTDGTFNLGNVGDTQQFQNFTNLGKQGLSTWTVTGTSNLPWTITAGTVNLASGSRLTGSVNIESAGVLSGIGTVANNVTNSGTLAPGTPAANPTTSSLGTLTIQGNYVGNPGSSLDIRAQLGSDTSHTDQLVINGTVSGQTQLNIIVLPDSTGGKTTSGIQLITVNNSQSNLQNAPLAALSAENVQTAANGVFTLAHPVQAGIYEYFLTQQDNNWYLESTLTRYSIPAYVLGHIDDLEYGFSTLGDLHSRVGDVEIMDGSQGSTGKGSWARLEGQTLQLDGTLFSVKDNYFYFLQAGKDLPLGNFGLATGQTHSGLMITLGGINGRFYDNKRSLYGLDTFTSSMRTQSAALGLYWTHYWDNRAYLDAVFQGSYYNNRYSDNCSTCSNSANQNGWGETISLEGGYPIALSTSGWALEPQLQLAFQHLGMNAFTDNVSSISGTNDDALRGRFGFRFFQAHRKTKLPAYDIISPYLLANVYGQFTDPASITVSSTSLNETPGRVWLEVGGGLMAPLAKQILYSFIDLRYQTSFGNRQSAQAVIGLRWNI